MHKFSPMPQAMKSPGAKAAVEKEWEKWEKILAWQLTKVRNKKEVIEEARNEGRKVHFCVFDGSLSSWEFGAGTSVSKDKGRVVLRGDIVKDDAGSYAVLTEQGSSASQMTAAKVMDIISRIPGCAGQAADAVSAYTQVKNGRCINVTENSKVRMSRYLDTSTEAQMAKIMVPAWKTQSFHSKGICTVTLWQDCYGKGNFRKFYWSTIGEKFLIGTVHLSIEQEDYSCQCMWTISNCQARLKT